MLCIQVIILILIVFMIKCVVLSWFVYVSKKTCGMPGVKTFASLKNGSVNAVW